VAALFRGALLASPALVRVARDVGEAGGSVGRYVLFGLRSFRPDPFLWRL
jgi:hypothetical protein